MRFYITKHKIQSWIQKIQNKDKSSLRRQSDSLLHKSSESKPQTVPKGEVSLVDLSTLLIIDAPRRFTPVLVGTEPTDQEHGKADTQVGEADASPDIVVNGSHEAEHPWLLFLWFLDHDGNAEVHEGLAEVHHPLSDWGNRQRGDGHICLLGVVVIIIIIIIIIIINANIR